MSKWYINSKCMVLLDDVTCVQKCEDSVRVRHGLVDNWDYIRTEGKTKQQKAESIEKIYKTVQEILTKPLDK